MKEKLKKLKELVTQKENLLAVGWGILALFMELGSAPFTAAPNAAALAAGLSGIPSLCAMLGGVLGALFHGIPAGFVG